MEIEFKDIPDYADLFTLEEFEQDVANGLYINYDGTGYFSDGKTMAIFPITIKNGKVLDIPGFTTHIVWFNR